MSSSSEHRVGVDQIYSALVALRAEPVMDPEARPDGPQPEDRLRLLGALLAAVELEITAATRIDDEFYQGFTGVIGGWAETVGANAAPAYLVITNRLQRTAVQMMQPEDEEKKRPGQAASVAAAMAGADLLAAQLAADYGSLDGARRSLNRAEGSLANIVVGMHVLRVGLGDVED
ncbi:hypothetical protein N4G69_37155 [Streptomyces mirabilis]|uniref:hypothetical protein n=1 Tax=Streptomyces mirabilis TaxID=68239 RepID=UPI0021C207C0|nr:hypothetical protein [Streptomyces mirabilis]MCT9111160.1 hypothetical protein [Streptomyces mirabilis]